VAAVPPCPKTAVFANPGGSGVTPTEKEEAIMRIADAALTAAAHGVTMPLSATPGSFGERARSHSERDGSCIFQ